MRNQRLARALDEIREHKKPQSRERFEVLLRELYLLAPEVWDEYHNTDLGLSSTRATVVKKIEQRLSSQRDSAEPPPPEEIELAAFAARERLLKQGRDAGLPPREYELFKLFVEDPDMPYREAAQRLGISVGTVGALKSRIKKTLRTA
jgi:RNA polymerase sigma factor (sigma-70 family)